MPISDDMDTFSSNGDIFSKRIKNKIINSANNKNRDNNEDDDFKVKSSCSYLNKTNTVKYNLFHIRNNIINNNFDKSFNKFKYHLLHHNEEFNEIIGKKKLPPSCTHYNPKMDFICRKFIYSVPFKKMSGRKDFSVKEVNKIITSDKSIKNIKKYKTFESKDLKINSGRNPIKLLKYEKFIPGSINMKYQLSRQPLPTHNDFRIRYGHLSVNEKNQNFPEKKMYRTYFAFKVNNERLKPNFSQDFKSAKDLEINSNTHSSPNNQTKKTSISMVNINNKDYFKENENVQKDNKIQNNTNNKEKAINTYRKIIKKQIGSKVHEKLFNNKEKNKKDEKYRTYYKNMADYVQNLNQKKMLNVSARSSFSIYDKSKKSQNNSKSILNESKSIIDEKTEKKKYKAINFEKMLSREYLEKINKIDKQIHPLIIPNYSGVEPRIIMKVYYAKRRPIKKPERFHGLNGEFTYDINKIFYKYNNHVSPIVCNFNKLTGRRGIENSGLPLFMKGLTDRSSINSFNENSFKMNNYSNGSLIGTKSSFNDKKSYNIRIQLEELKNNNHNLNIVEYKKKLDENKTRKMIVDKIRIKNMENKDDISYNNNESKIKIKKTYWRNLLGEFYRINLDDLDQTHYSFIGTKVDGITLKAYNSKDKYPNLLSKKEKERFLCYK